MKNIDIEQNKEQGFPRFSHAGVLTGNGEIKKENVVNLSDETLEKWKKFLEEDRIRTEKENKKKETMDRIKADPNYEKYRDAICVDGRRENDFGFEMLFFLHKHLEETPADELQKEWDAVSKLNTDPIEFNDNHNYSPTVEEYFEGLNPAAQKLKGYSEGAKAFMDKLELRLKEDERPVIPVSDILEIAKNIYKNE